jgi:DNA-binding transcriptional MerR regulator
VAAVEKAPGAFKTIGELSVELGVAQHILRYWETKFPQLKPLQRAGNRRYYRPADVELAHRINQLLNQEGYTVRGVQKLLRGAQPAEEQPSQPISRQEESIIPRVEVRPSIDADRLRQIRDRLAEALDQ